MPSCVTLVFGAKIFPPILTFKAASRSFTIGRVYRSSQLLFLCLGLVRMRAAWWIHSRTQSSLGRNSVRPEMLSVLGEVSRPKRSWGRFWVPQPMAAWFREIVVLYTCQFASSSGTMNSEDIPLTAIYVLGRVELLHLAEPMLFFLCHGFARGKEDGNESGDSDEKNDEREGEKNLLIAILFLPLSILTSKEAFPSVYLSLPLSTFADSQGQS